MSIGRYGIVLRIYKKWRTCCRSIENVSFILAECIKYQSLIIGKLIFTFPWRKFRIGIHFQPIRTIPNHFEIYIQANENKSEPNRKKFSKSFVENHLKINWLNWKFGLDQSDPDWFGLEIWFTLSPTQILEWFGIVSDWKGMNSSLKLSPGLR